jgi:hypothetical protein
MSFNISQTQSTKPSLQVFLPISHCKDSKANITYQREKRNSKKAFKTNKQTNKH